MKALRSVRRTTVAVLCFSLVCTIAALAQNRVAARPQTGAVLLPPEGDSVPMLDFGGRPVVDVMIDAKGPYRFILDTGASVSVIDSSLAAELSLGDKPTIKELRVGKARVQNVQTLVNPISRMLGSGDVPRGILNASSFSGNLVTFDFAAKQISFHRGALPRANGRNIFDYDPADLPSLPVKVAGREFTVHFDTGAPYPLALPTKHIPELPLVAPPVQKGTAKTHIGMLPVFIGSLNGDIEIGEFKLPTRDVRFTDVVPFGAAEPKGQVGDEALREFVVTFDAANHRIRLERS